MGDLVSLEKDPEADGGNLDKDDQEDVVIP